MNKSYLWKIREIDREIDKLCEKYEALGLSLLPSGIRYDKDKVQTSPEDSMSEVVAQRFELDNEIKSKRVERAMLVNEICDAIEQLENDRSQLVLMKYFINGKSIRSIGYELGISKSAVHKIYKKALQEFGRGAE